LKFVGARDILSAENYIRKPCFIAIARTRKGAGTHEKVTGRLSILREIGQERGSKECFPPEPGSMSAENAVCL